MALSSRNANRVLLVRILGLALLVGDVTAARAAEWTLATADTRLSLAVSNNHLYVTQLDNPARGWNWIATPAVFPFVAQASIGGVTTNLTWQFLDGTLDTSLGQKLTLRFQATEVALELTSEWWARPGRGPVRQAPNGTRSGLKTA